MLLRTANLFLHSYAQYLKRQMSYRFNFWVQTIALFVWSAANVFLIHYLFLTTDEIRGWDRAEVMLIYGIANCSFAVCFTFFASLLHLPSRYIVEGQLDRLLVRPFNPLLQVLMEDFSAEDSLLFLFGFLIIGYAFREMGEVPTAGTWALVVLAAISGGAVYGSGLLFAASASFWLKDRAGLLGPAIQVGDQVARYPLGIYPALLRWILTFAIPLGFIAYYPSQLLLPSHGHLLYGVVSPLVALTVLSLAYAFWRAGLRRYESTGS